MFALMLLAIASSDVQRMIDEAGTDAVVVLPAGEIKGDLIVRTSVTLRGAGAGKTILRGSGSGPVVTITTEKGRVRIEKVSITGGAQSLVGGGILHRGHAPLFLEDLELYENKATVGGGLNVHSSPVTLRRVSIHDNHGQLGAGASIGSGPVLIEVSSFVNNHGESTAGLLCVAELAELRDTRFEGNTTEVGDAAHAFFSTDVRDGKVILERVHFGPSSGRAVERGKAEKKPTVIAKETKWDF